MKYDDAIQSTTAYATRPSPAIQRIARRRRRCRRRRASCASFTIAQSCEDGLSLFGVVCTIAEPRPNGSECPACLGQNFPLDLRRRDDREAPSLEVHAGLSVGAGEGVRDVGVWGFVDPRVGVKDLLHCDMQVDWP